MLDSWFRCFLLLSDIDSVIIMIMAILTLGNIDYCYPSTLP